MSDDAVVTVVELRALANRLCDAIEARGLTAARFERREYWVAYFEDMFGDLPPEPVVGDLVHDLRDARAELSVGEDEPVVWHAAQHLAGLVNALAYADLTGRLVREVD